MATKGLLLLAVAHAVLHAAADQGDECIMDCPGLDALFDGSVNPDNDSPGFCGIVVANYETWLDPDVCLSDDTSPCPEDMVEEIIPMFTYMGQACGECLASVAVWDYCNDLGSDMQNEEHPECADIWACLTSGEVCNTPHQFCEWMFDAYRMRFYECTDDMECCNDPDWTGIYPGAKSAAVKHTKLPLPMHTRGDLDLPEPGDTINCGDLAFMVAIDVLDTDTVCSTDADSDWAAIGVYDNCIHLCDNCPVPDGYFTDFESCEEGDWITVCDPNFVVWPGGQSGVGGPTGYDVNVFVCSDGMKVLYLEASLYSDVVLEFHQLISEGFFNYEQYMYVPEGKFAYMNFQGSETIGAAWSLNAFFYNTSLVTISDGTNEQIYSGTFPVGESFIFRFEADLSTGVWTVFTGEESGSFELSAPVASANLYAACSNEFFIGHVAWDKEEPTTLPGDMNGDGTLNVLDVVQLVNAILAGEFNPVGDVNSDGSLDVLDAVQLINAILGGKK